VARWRISWCFFALLAGCAARGPSDFVDPIQQTLESTDRQLDRGRNLEALEEALEIYQSLADEVPSDLRVAEKLTRALYLRGYVFPDVEPPPHAFFESARTTGWNCLSAGTGLVLGSVARGNKQDVTGYERVDSDRAGCMVYTTLAWARWLSARGTAAMALDLVPLKALAQGAVTVAGTMEAGKAEHAYALVLALDAAQGDTEWEDAEAAFQVAIKRAPEDFSRVVDWVEWVLIPTGNEKRARRVLRELADAQPVGRVNSEQAGSPSDIRAFERAVDLANDLSTTSLSTLEADRLDEN